MQSILHVLALAILRGMMQVQAAETGNSLVTCAACQTLQAQIDNWSCDINCRVANSNNGTFWRFYFRNGIFIHCLHLLVKSPIKNRGVN